MATQSSWNIEMCPKTMSSDIGRWILLSIFWNVTLEVDEQVYHSLLW